MTFITVNNMPRWVDVINAFQTGEGSRIDEAVDYIVTMLMDNKDINVYQCLTAPPELLTEANRDVVLELWNSRYWINFRNESDTYNERFVFSLRSTLDDVLKLTQRLEADTPKGANSIINKMKELIPYNNNQFISLADTDLINLIAERTKEKSEVEIQPAYTTEYLELIKLAINQFFYPRKNIDPKQIEVTEWLKIKGKDLNINVANHVANVIFTIIKPNDHNPKKKRVEPL